jgi:hypothetical protein
MRECNFVLQFISDEGEGAEEGTRSSSSCANVRSMRMSARGVDVGRGPNCGAPRGDDFHFPGDPGYGSHRLLTVKTISDSG